MQDGFKWTITGGVIGLLLLGLFVFGVSRFSGKMTEVKMDWLVMATIPFAIAIMAWWTKFTSKINEETLKRIFDAIDKKADDSSVIALKEYIDEHKKTDENNYKNVEVRYESIDKKLNILIEKGLH